MSLADPIMVKTWVFATSALAVAAFTLFRRWRRRAGRSVGATSQTVSEEWLSNARGQRDERWNG